MTATEIFYEAMRRTDSGDQDGFLAMFADDCHWIVPGAEFLQEELRGWLTPFWQGFSTFRHDIHRAVAETDDAVSRRGHLDRHARRHDPDARRRGAADRPHVSFRFAIAATRDPERRPGEERQPVLRQPRVPRPAGRAPGGRTDRGVNPEAPSASSAATGRGLVADAVQRTLRMRTWSTWPTRHGRPMPVGRAPWCRIAWAGWPPTWSSSMGASSSSWPRSRRRSTGSTRRGPGSAPSRSWGWSRGRSWRGPPRSRARGRCGPSSARVRARSAASGGAEARPRPLAPGRDRPATPTWSPSCAPTPAPTRPPTAFGERAGARGGVGLCDRPRDGLVARRKRRGRRTSSAPLRLRSPDDAHRHVRWCRLEARTPTPCARPRAVGRDRRRRERDRRRARLGAHVGPRDGRDHAPRASRRSSR